MVLNNSFGNSSSGSSWGVSLLRGEGNGFWRMTRLPPVPFWKSLRSSLQFQSKRHSKTTRQAHLLLVSPAFHGKMPNPNKTSSHGPPRAMGLIQQQGLQEGGLPWLRCSCCCGPRGLQLPASLEASPEWLKPGASPGASSQQAPKVQGCSEALPAQQTKPGFGCLSFVCCFRPHPETMAGLKV